MPQLQCARCGAAYFTAPNGVGTCPFCGLPFGVEGPSPQSTWLPPLDDQPSYPSGYGAPSAPSWRDPSVADWQTPASLSPNYRPGGQVDERGAPIGPYGAAGIGSQFVYHHTPDSVAPAPPPDSEPRSGAGRLAATIGVALVVVIVLGLVGIVYAGGPINKQVKNGPTPTPTFGPPPTPTSPPLPSGFTQYTDPGGLFSVGVPSEWTDITGQVSGTDSLPRGTNFVVFVDEAQAGVLEIIDEPGDASAITGVETQALTTAARQATLTNQSGPQTITLAGASWTQRTTDATPYSVNQTIHLVIIGTARDHHAVFILYGSEVSAYNRLDATYFQPMLATFTFRG